MFMHKLVGNATKSSYLFEKHISIYGSDSIYNACNTD